MTRPQAACLGEERGQRRKAEDDGAERPLAQGPQERRPGPLGGHRHLGGAFARMYDWSGRVVVL